MAKLRSSFNARGKFHKKRPGTPSFMDRHGQVYASPSIKRSPDYKRAVRMEKSLHQRYPGAVFGNSPLPSAGRREAERVMKAFERAHFYDWADNYRRALKRKTTAGRTARDVSKSGNTARFYSGNVRVDLKILGDSESYRCVVYVDGKKRWSGVVNAPRAGFGRGVAYDSTIAYKKTASAALSFADHEKPGILDGASWGSSGPVLRTWKR